MCTFRVAIEYITPTEFKYSLQIFANILLYLYYFTTIFEICELDFDG